MALSNQNFASAWPPIQQRQGILKLTWGLSFVVLSVISFHFFTTANWQGIHIRDPDAMKAFVETLAQVLADILGFTVSIVAIVVQLSADRFTPKVTELFLRERTNFIVISFLILANLISVWTVLAFGVIRDPFPLVILNLILGTLAFLILLPYFRFVFDFLQPMSIINKIEQQIKQRLINFKNNDHHKSHVISNIKSHQSCLASLDELKGITLSAIRQRESLIILGSLNSFRNFLLFYSDIKSDLPESWFKLTDIILQDPDFVCVDPGRLSRIESNRLWTELKVFCQFQIIFAESVNEWRESCTLISLTSRYIAEKSLAKQDYKLLELVITFFNTYLRLAINARDIRTAYNMLKQYRIVGEQALELGKYQYVLDIANHFRYYSLVAYKMELLFLCETFAFDLGKLAEASYGKAPEVNLSLLEILLTIDQDADVTEQQEISLQGIRKSQVKLAAFYLSQQEEFLARKIYDDIKIEPETRLMQIWKELRSTQLDFWEFTDRGENFYYVEPSLLVHVDTFFGWFGLKNSLGS